MDQPLCNICLQPKQVHGSGSLTEWFSVCHCNDKGSEVELYSSLRICTNCKQKINAGRQGSFTQWIFKSGLCNCDRPTITADPGEEKSSAASFEIIDYPELQDIETDFPRDRFKPIEEIGRGASGVVFRSQDRLLNKIVAVKMLLNLDPDLIVSFQEEAKITASLSHPNIIKIIDISVTDTGAPYMVFEYVAGGSLTSYLQDEYKPKWEKAVEIFQQICNAVEYSHEKGILHRDIQPSNILLTKDLEDHLLVKVIDFGISEIWQREDNSVDYQGSTIAGTPGYMSPDQANGFAYDTKSDIYSLGCVLFELVSGKLPFQGDSALEILNNQLKDSNEELLLAISEIDVPQNLKQVIGKCIQANPAERYESVKQLKVDLARCIEVDILDNAVSDELESDQVREDFLLEKPKQGAGRSKRGIIFIFGSMAVLILFVLFQHLFSLENWGLPFLKGKYNNAGEIVYPETQIAGSFESMSDRDLGALIPHKSPDGSYRGNEFVTDNFLKKLKSRNDIKKLDLSHSSVYGKGLVYLKSLPMESLNLEELPVTDNDLLPLAETPTLKILYLLKTKVTGSQMERFKYVEQVFAKKCPLTDQGLKSISLMPKLVVLSVSVDKITPKGFSYLAKNSPLGVLVLHGKNDLSEKLPEIAKIKKLFNLQYHHRHVLKNDLSVAKDMNLKTFYLQKCTIEDGGFEIISQMKTLTSLSFRKTAVPLAMEKKLRKSLPNCKISLDE